MTLAAVLAAALIWSVAPLEAAQRSSSVDDVDITAAIDRQAAHEVRLEYVREGEEGILLSAKLSENGGLIQKPIFWTVVSATGETLYKGDEPMPSIAAEAGDYEVTARYGTVTVRRTVSLVPQQRVGLTFVLNVGALRVLPRIDLESPVDLQPLTTIYATSGRSKGMLVAKSTIPGEVVRLGAGSYRIESQFSPGNATATMDVSVEAGMMSAVDLKLPAGVARLTANAAQDQVTWSIIDEEGKSLPSISAPVAEVALKPGSYTARAVVGTRELLAKFSIKSGETREIILSE